MPDRRDTPRFEVVTLRSGAHAVRHLGHGEVMHPVGPWEEANGLYVTQLRLAEALGETGPCLRILDVGLGGAANAGAAVACARALPGRRRELEIVSLENDLQPLELTVADPAAFPALAPLDDALRGVLATGQWCEPGIRWRLVLGDAEASLDPSLGRFDRVFFDPFSPKANPRLWARPFLSRVRGACAEHALLATYSAATPTRVGFLLAGFFVGEGASTGSRTATTVASTDLGALERPLGQRWLQRWRRSDSRAPHGEVLTDELARALEGHPQFARPSKPNGAM